MTFLNKILKRKVKPEDSLVKKEKSEKTAKEGVIVREVKKAGKIILGVIRAPHITEKTSSAAKENKYVFSVASSANKHEVKKAVEARYGAGVSAVNILNTPGKERKRGKQIGWKPGFKKAIVKVQEGQTIEIQ